MGEEATLGLLRPGDPIGSPGEAYEAAGVGTSCRLRPLTLEGPADDVDGVCCIM